MADKLVKGVNGPSQQDFDYVLRNFGELNALDYLANWGKPPRSLEEQGMTIRVEQ